MTSRRDGGLDGPDGLEGLIGSRDVAQESGPDAARPLEVLDQFHRLHVLVVGEAMLDTYLSGRASRLSREAPVPIVAVDERSDMPGGAANAAVNLAALGATVDFVSAVGADAAGGVLAGAIEATGVAAANLIAETGRETMTKRRVAADGQLLVRFDEGSTTAIESATERRLIERLERLWQRADAVLVSDYDYGVLTPRVRATLVALQKTSPRTVVVDAKDPTRYRSLAPTAVKPNYEEAVRLIGAQPTVDSNVRLHQVVSNSARLLEQTGARVVAVTLDRDGALVLERDQPTFRTYARPNPHSRAAGAGDTFVTGMTLALAVGAPASVAAEIGAAAAAIVVEKSGTATCAAHELRDHFASRSKVIDDARHLLARLSTLEEQGRRIVFSNGCFDILHRGHITYLNRAKALGDVLIVGLNSDDSVRRLKGDGRPINSLDDRAQVLAALSAVDHIVPFDEDTPVDLIRLIKPAVFVKGGDYSIESLREAPVVEALGGEVRILPFVEDRSTTRIIERVRGGAARGVMLDSVRSN
jgi:D-beta-D-heptose 7-phosphate kinase/D-beta-D-heptose 1-phosphate adenosyltransferase